MKLYTIWLQYEQRYTGEYLPELHDAWTEHTRDDNQAGYDEALGKARALEADPGSGIESVREIEIIVTDEAVLAAFEAPRIGGKVLP